MGRMRHKGRRAERVASPTGRRPSPTGDSVLIYGLHAVAAALANPNRTVLSLRVTANAAARLAPALVGRTITPRLTTPADLDRLLGPGAVHQGVVIEAAPLPQPELEDLARASLLVLLDQVTDPHNVGAILRSAAAFGAGGLVVTQRHAPALSAALAKAASGALEHVPVVAVTNLARGLARLGDLGFTRIGLEGSGSEPLEQVLPPPPVALVLGAEDKGLRRLTKEHCDRLCRLSTSGPLASLNVSNAAAIALHAVTTSPAWRDARCGPANQGAAAVRAGADSMTGGPRPALPDRPGDQ